ncbi:MAG: WD40 repeat domain-containing protein [Ignavibacteria bacterium]|jgi:WD40 repeat protein
MNNNDSTCANKNFKWAHVPNHGTYINSVAISADGNKAVGGTFFHSYNGRKKNGTSEYNNFGTYCYARSGELLWSDVFKGWQGVYWVDISTDGNFAASGGWYSSSPVKGFVRGYNAVTGEKILDHPTNIRVNKVALSADGASLIAGAESLYLFTLQNNAYELTDTYKLDNNSAEVISCSISGDGTWMIFSDYSGCIYLLKNEGGKFTEKGKWKLACGGFCHTLQITPNGEWFAVGGADGYFYSFNTEDFIANQKPYWSYQISSKESLYGIAISNDGQNVAAICNDGDAGLVYLVQTVNKTPVLKWEFYTLRNPNSVSFDGEANYITVADGHPDGVPGHFYLLNIKEKKCMWFYTSGNMNWPMEISEDGTGIIAGSDDSHIYYFTP